MAAQQKRIRVLIAQQNPPLNEALAQALSREPDLDIIATAATMVEAVTRTVDMHPDVLLLDRDLPGETDVDIRTVIRYLRPDTKVVFVGEDVQASAEGDDRQAIRSLQADHGIVDQVRAVGRRSASSGKAVVG